MVLLVEPSEVLTRLSEIPNLPLPSNITPERLTGYISEASGVLMRAAGMKDPPRTGVGDRDALNGLCIRYVVSLVQGDLWATDAGMVASLQRTRDGLLREAALFTEATDSGGFTFGVAGAE